MKNKKLVIIIIISIFFAYFIEIDAYAVNTIKSVYFYSPTCSDCLSIEKEFDKDKNNIRYLDVSDINNLNLFFKFCETYNIADKARSVPILFVGNTAYTNVEDIVYCMQNNKINENTKDLLVNIDMNYNYIRQNNTKLTVVYLFFAGLLDGFNPCAVAMLLLLISLLGFVNDKRKIIKLSTSFISGIFITYYAIGTSLYSFVSKIDFSIISILIKYFILGLCAILFILNIKDAINSSKMKHQKIVLQLPKRIKKFNKCLMNKVISIQNKKFVYLIYFGLGMAISFTEFMCTGQIYLPIILLMWQTPNISFGEICFNFFVYNVSFVLPLVVISIIAINKNKVVSISSIFVEKMFLIKIINAIFYLTLGIIVLYLFIL
ncbi:MAG: cytochrome c biogenesis CcdA family protein [Lachnotalea sp.]